MSCKPTPNPQDGGPPLIGCPRLLIQLLGATPNFWRPSPPSATWGRAMPWWQGTHLTWSFYHWTIKCLATDSILKNKPHTLSRSHNKPHS
jgi:hypothetical protein